MEFPQLKASSEGFHSSQLYQLPWNTNQHGVMAKSRYWDCHHGHLHTSRVVSDTGTRQRTCSHFTRNTVQCVWSTARVEAQHTDPLCYSCTCIGKDNNLHVEPASQQCLHLKIDQRQHIGLPPGSCRIQLWMTNSPDNRYKPTLEISFLMEKNDSFLTLHTVLPGNKADQICPQDELGSLQGALTMLPDPLWGHRSLSYRQQKQRRQFKPLDPSWSKYPTSLDHDPFQHVLNNADCLLNNLFFAGLLYCTIVHVLL